MSILHWEAVPFCVKSSVDPKTVFQETGNVAVGQEAFAQHV